MSFMQQALGLKFVECVLCFIQDNEEMIAIMEKTRMFVLKGAEAEVTTFECS